METPAKPSSDALYQRWRRADPLVRNSAWVIAGRVARLSLQASYFILLTRALGAAQYGAFIGAVALAAIISPFSTWGSGAILIKRTAIDPERFREHWGRALAVSGLFAAILIPCALLASRFLLPGAISLGLIVPVLVGDLFFAPLAELCSQSFHGFQRLKRSAQIVSAMGASRFLVAAAFWLFSTRFDSAAGWAPGYALSSAIPALGAFILVGRQLGWPDFRSAWRDWELGEGFHFALGGVSATIYNDIDKTMLARLSTLQATGIYAAAYRVINACVIPIGGMIAASLPKFFQDGQRGIRGCMGLARRLIAVAAAYALCGALALYVLSPLLPLLTGKGFGAAASALRWLCLLPFFKAFSLFFANALAGGGYQPRRSAIQAAVAVFNVLINLWLIPAHGWKGAAWASLASDALLSLALGAQVWLLVRREKAAAAELSP